jgi:flagellar biogenesis protein FliO
VFEEIAAGQGANLITAIAVVGVALVALYVVARLMRARSNATFIRGGRNRQPRLAVLDAAAVDARRRLVLVRRDDVEHLILIGGPTDVVVESRIGAQSAATAPDANGEERRPGDPRRDESFGDALARVERGHGERTPADEQPARIAERPAPAPAPAPAKRATERPAAVEPAVAPVRSEPVRPEPVVAERPSAPVFEPANQSRIAPLAPVPPQAPVPAPAPVPAFAAATGATPRPPMVVLPSRDPVLDPAPDAGHIREQAIDALDQARARVLADPEPPVAARAAEAPVANVNPYAEYEDIAADVPKPAPRTFAVEPPRVAEPPRPAIPTAAAAPATEVSQRTTDQVMSDFEAVLEAELSGDLSGFAPGRPTVAPARPITVAPHPATGVEPHPAAEAGDNSRTPLDDEMDRLLGDLSRRP